MTLIVIGINHNTAPLSLREQVAFAPEQMNEALAGARCEGQVNEVAILSTCNRTEVYGVGELDSNRLFEWLCQYHQLDANELTTCYYSYQGDEAIRHMMRVACGLDSLVLGEPQILGQMKSAYAVAHDANTIEAHLHSAFQQVFKTAKRVRTETAIGANPVSVAYAAVSLAQQIFSDLRQDTALLIGAGDTIELVARHLSEQGIAKLIVANRTLSRAQELADKFNAKAVLLSDIPEQLHRADIVISSTASQLPILGKGAVESALKQRKHKPMFMVDIAVPRDIEAQVAELDDVYLYSVDDLREVIEVNRRSREEEAVKASQIVGEGVDFFRREVRALNVVSTIKAYRRKAEELRDEELAKAVRQLDGGVDAEQVLNQLARNLTNKFLHTPTAKLKEAGQSGRQEFIGVSQELFEISERDIDKDTE